MPIQQMFIGLGNVIDLGLTHVMDAVTGESTTITVPSVGPQAGDLAILWDTALRWQTNSLIPPVTPSGWTLIDMEADSGSTHVNFTIWSGVAIWSYKILTPGDLGAVVTGMAQGDPSTVTQSQVRKNLHIFRPNRPLVNIIKNGFNSDIDPGTPSNQNLSMAGVEPPIIGFAGYRTISANPSVRGSSGITMVEVPNEDPTPRQYTKYIAYEKGDVPGNGVISMQDFGYVNILQSFYLTFTFT